MTHVMTGKERRYILLRSNLYFPTQLSKEGELPTTTVDEIHGRPDRQQAAARSSNRLLPHGIVNTFTLVSPETRRVRNLDVNWLDTSVPPWTPQIKTWLDGAAQ